MSSPPSPSPDDEWTNDRRQQAQVCEHDEDDRTRSKGDPRERANSVHEDRRGDQCYRREENDRPAMMRAVHASSRRLSVSRPEASATTKFRSFIPSGPLRVGVRPASTRSFTMSSTST